MYRPPKRERGSQSPRTFTGKRTRKGLIKQQRETPILYKPLEASTPVPHVSGKQWEVSWWLVYIEISRPLPFTIEKKFIRVILKNAFHRTNHVDLKQSNCCSYHELFSTTNSQVDMHESDMALKWKKLWAIHLAWIEVNLPSIAASGFHKIIPRLWDKMI